MLCVRKSIHRLSAAERERADLNDGEEMLIVFSSSYGFPTSTKTNSFMSNICDPYIDENITVSVLLLQQQGIGGSNYV